MHTEQHRGLVVKGNTYPIRAELSRIGCEYDGATRNWTARDYPMLKAAYQILDNYKAGEELKKMTPEQLLEKAGKVSRGEALSLVRNKRQTPPIGAIMSHPLHGMVLVIRTGECFLDLTEGPEAWKSRYTGIPVSDKEPESISVASTGQLVGAQ